MLFKLLKKWHWVHTWGKWKVEPGTMGIYQFKHCTVCNKKKISGVFGL